MDDSNYTQNLTSISPDKKDNMTSVSTPKRTIVLGVVNTTGMKSANVNRKRRWDQPPEDISGSNIAKKLCVSENETYPVKENESPETVNAVEPIVDRVNSQSDHTPFVSNQIAAKNISEIEEKSVELVESDHEHISSEASAMSIDLPEDGIDRLSPSIEEDSSEIRCSETVEKLSEVSILETCDRLKPNDKLDSPPPDSRLVIVEDSNKVESSCVSSCETKIKKSNISATVISHQSDELRRIMFSYDEGSSDSDTMDSNSFKEEKSTTTTFQTNIDDVKDKISSDKKCVQKDELQSAGRLPISEEPVNNLEVIEFISEGSKVSDNSASSISPLVDDAETSSSILAEFNSKATDAFIETNYSPKIIKMVEESLIESQDNIPDSSESVVLTNNNKLDSIISEKCSMHEGNDTQHQIDSPESSNEGMGENLPSDLNAESLSSKINHELENRTSEEINQHESKKCDSSHHDQVKNIQTDSILGIGEDNSSCQMSHETVDKQTFNEVVFNEDVSCDTGQLMDDSTEIKNFHSPCTENTDVKVVDPTLEGHFSAQRIEVSHNPSLESFIENEVVTAEDQTSSTNTSGLPVCQQVEVNENKDLNLEKVMTSQETVEDTARNVCLSNTESYRVSNDNPLIDDSTSKVIQIPEEPNNSVNSLNDDIAPIMGTRREIPSSGDRSTKNDGSVNFSTYIEDSSEKKSEFIANRESDISSKEKISTDEKFNEILAKISSEGQGLDYKPEKEILLVKDADIEGLASTNVSSLETVDYHEEQTSEIKTAVELDNQSESTMMNQSDNPYNLETDLKGTVEIEIPEEIEIIKIEPEKKEDFGGSSMTDGSHIVDSDMDKGIHHITTPISNDNSEFRAINDNISLSDSEMEKKFNSAVDTDLEIGTPMESIETEIETIQNPDAEPVFVENVDIEGDKVISDKDLSVDIENTKNKANLSVIEVADTNVIAVECSDVEPIPTEDTETCHNKNVEEVETRPGSIKTKISSMEIEISTNSDEIEGSTEENIETEISIEENVENELCSMENDEISVIETELNSLDNSKDEVKGEENIEPHSSTELVGENDVLMKKSDTEQTNIVANSIDDDENSNILPEDKTEMNGNKEIGCLEIEKEISVAGSEEPIIQEGGTLENSTSDECLYDESSTTAAEGLEINSLENASYEEVLNQSPEESKNFEESIDVSETVITDEPVVDGDSILDNVVLMDENKTIIQEAGSPTEISSEISFVEENSLQDDSKNLTEDIESFVVEEVVTCESMESDKVENVLDIANDNTSSIVLEEACEVTETSSVSSPPSAVIKENVVKEVSDNNPSNVFIDWNLELKKSNELSVDKFKKHTGFSKDLKNEPLLNSIKPVEMEFKTNVNSITTTLPSFAVEEMEVDDVPSLDLPNINIKPDSIVVERSPASLKNLDCDLPKSVKDGANIPLLKTVTNSVVSKKEKPPTPVDEVSRSGSIPCPDPKLEPITLRIYKDNLSVKTDDLDSPKKNKSPKLSSELKSQHSPHIKSDNRSSLSPTTKKLEFTLKIAKDVNTNIPRATMSPKNNVSPSIHKSGDILRAELTGESGRNSPAYASPDSATNKVKLKISKQSPTGLSKDYNLSHLQSSSVKEENLVNSDGISLPKPAIEIGNVFKKMMETEKNVEIKSEVIALDHSLISNPSTPVPLVKKRGRPRKILHKVLSSGADDSSINSSPLLDSSSTASLNHSPNVSIDFDLSGGIDNSDLNSSRQVRSCRARTKPIVVKTRKPRGGGVGRGGMRGGRGGGITAGGTSGGIARLLTADKDPEKLAEKLSEKEKAELAKIEERKERQRLERIAKNEAKKAKKLARKLKDEERRLKRLREKAEKAEAAAPQVFEEETRMSAPDGSSRGHTPAPASALSRLNQTSEHNEESQNSISTPTSSQIKRGRMEIPIDPESKEVRVDQLAEYQWQGSELFMIQEQVSLYLGVKSFKRKYPDLKRRPVEAEERTFLEDSGLVPKSMCDLGLTAVSSAEVLDIMYHDFPDKYEEFRKYVREKQAREAAFKQKAVFANLKQDKSKGEPREQALEAVAIWNSNLNRERREERRCALDLQTFTVHYPKQIRDKMSRPLPKAGLYPVSLIPGQFSDYYKVYTPTELMYFPLNTVMYGPLKPNERQPINPSDGSGSESSSSSSDDSSGSSTSDCESDDERGATRECKICNGEKKTIKESHPEILLQCSNCKGLCHPTCQEITPEMLPHIKKYNWHCSNCKKCMQCKNTSKDDKMLFCDLCDRGYHIHCVGLRKAPEGRWHCSVCSFCTVCGSKDPGGPEWNYEYKKTDKGVRLYQRTLCVPCSKNALM